MPIPSQFLLTAILDDDRATVKELLKKNSRLSTLAITEARYDSGIAH